MTLSLKPYRRAAVPLLAVQTADPAAVVRLAAAESRNGVDTPVLMWDCVHGLLAANLAAKEMGDAVNQGQEPAIMTSNPVEALRAIETLGRRMEPFVCVLLGLADVLTDPSAGIPARQALWNLRDVLPPSGALCVLTVPFGWTNPFPNDIPVVDDPLPDRAALRSLIERLSQDAGIEAVDAASQEGCCDALLGLSAFAAEQALALSIRKTGIDVASLWTRKRQQVAQTPGLSIYAGQERFADLGGLENAKRFFGQLLAGCRKPGAIVFIDEIEKALAGGSSDSSGVTQDQLGTLLAYMQDQAATGAIFLGHPGAAKSALAKTVGNEGGIPTIQLDLGATKNKFVGNSEAQLREALAVITAVSGGKPLFLATCNSITQLPPELRRRFTLGTLFFDLPTPEEQAGIWPIYLRQYGLPEQPLPACENWTGAEIKQCADLADRLGMTLVEAAAFVVPSWVAARESIEQRRKEANGRYLSATSPGVYRLPTPGQTLPSRKLEVD